MTTADENALLRIYDTIADHSLWPGVLDEIAGNINALGAMVFEWDAGHSPQRQLRTYAFSSFYDPPLVEGYIEKCGTEESRDQDVFEEHSLRTDGIDLIDDSVLAPSVEALRQRRNVQALERFGILHRAAGLLNKDNTASARFSVQFGADRGLLTSQERMYLGKVLPHVAKALDLGRPLTQLARKYQGVLAAMNRLHIGLCILDHKGRAITSNDEFNRQMEAYPVFRVDPQGYLRMQSSADAKRLDVLKAQARHHGHFGARPRKEAIRTSDDAFLCMEIAPLNRLDEAGSAPLQGFMLMSTDTSRPTQCNTAPIAQAFGLTPAETSLVASIAEGATNAQIAEQRDRALPTINTQVKSILSKTDCATRTQFVRLMMSFGADHLID